jgi:hypothetical protein
MKKRDSKHEYFENLESTVKVTLAVYLTILLFFTTLLLLNESVILAFLSTTGPWLVLGGTAAMLAVAFVLLYYGISKITWLGDFHIRLDQTLFGFLDRSNDAIFQTLASALTTGERKTASGFTPQHKNEITHAIFSSLATDRDLFGELLRSGIFRSWIWYWVATYGTFTFGILTLGAFARVWLNGSELPRFVFTLNWIMTLVHFVACIFLGRFLVGKTGRSVRQIVDAHRDAIANVLRLNIHGHPEIIEPEVAEDEG